MSQMTEPRELLLHELGDILYAENVLVKALPKMAKEATTPSCAQASRSTSRRRRATSTR